MRTTIIAEVGVNHNGNIDLAFELIDEAAKAGADIVKFQSFCANKLAIKNAPLANYQSKLKISKIDNQYLLLKKLEFDKLSFQKLITYSESKGIKFLASTFDIDSIDNMVSLGQSFFKIPSGEITNLPYLRHIAHQAEKVILSTGMATLFEITDALEILTSSKLLRENIVLLHCTTEYPAPMNEVNLRAIETLKREFNLKVGYSDHTYGIEVAIAAVTMGACIVEKHFTLDRNLDGPDHKASLLPHELSSMVTSIRNIEDALGNGIKKPTLSEDKNRIFVRKSIVAKCNIKKGEFFTVENLDVKRPGSGISPMLWDSIIGTRARRNYFEEEFIDF